MTPIRCITTAAVLLAAASFSHAATVWQVGIANGNNSDFVQENGSSNPAPGSATQRDDDWYFAGTYASPIGTLTEDEPLQNFERALTNNDHTNRIHFNLDAMYTGSDVLFELVIPTVSNNSQVSTDPIDFTVAFNGTQIFAGTVTQMHQSFTTPQFLASSVSASTGENVITITRSGSGAGWMQFDYFRLDGQVIPEPATLGLGLLAPAMLIRRRR